MEAMTLAGTGADAVRAVAGEDGRAKAGPSPAALGLDAALGWAASRSLAEAINGGTFARLEAGRADPTELATAVGLSVDRLLAQLAALGAQGLLYLEDDGQVILNPQARDAADAAAALLAAGVPAAPAAISWPVLDPAIGGWAGALLRPRGRWLVLGGDAGFAEGFARLGGVEVVQIDEADPAFAAALADPGQDWPQGLDGVLILRGLGRQHKSLISAAIEASEEALGPDGRFACLDLMLDDDYSGPRHAGLWSYAQADLGSEAPPLTLNFLGLRLAEVGFAPPSSADAPDGIHRLVWSLRD